MKSPANLKPILSGALLCGMLALSACAVPTSSKPNPGVQVSRPAPVIDPDDIEQAAFLSCVPYARSASGVQLYGDAWTWWKGADGKYAKGQQPQKGAVLTLQKTKSLPMGHVAVVVALSEDPRKLWVDHANWGDNGGTRGKVHKRQPVIDVSKANDWSEVRFMNTLGSFGRVYAAHGFIYADDGKLPGAPAPSTRTAALNQKL